MRCALNWLCESDRLLFLSKTSSSPLNLPKTICCRESRVWDRYSWFQCGWTFSWAYWDWLHWWCPSYTSSCCWLSSTPPPTGCTPWCWRRSPSFSYAETACGGCPLLCQSSSCSGYSTWGVNRNAPSHSWQTPFSGWRAGSNLQQLRRTRNCPGKQQTKDTNHRASQPSLTFWSV